MEPKDAIHKNHRDRIRERALKEGLCSFSDHELLELMLFYSIPRVDTNPIAHALLREFGSIKAIFDATEDELCRVDGIGAKTAAQIRLTIELMRRYEQGCYEKVRSYAHMSDVVEYLHPLFYGINVEHVYIMLFNNAMGLIDCVLISEGDVNCSETSIRKITELVLNRKVSAVILAHNHPSGLAIPSSEDLHFTDTLNSYLKTLGVVMIEHIVFSDTNYQPIMRQHCGMFRCSPTSRRLEIEFYERFYNKEPEDYRFNPVFHEWDQENQTIVKS